MKLWKCGACGFIHEGDDAPEKCPKCGVPKEQFRELTGEEAELVLKSRRTNDLHMKLFTLLEKIHAISTEGQDLNLDPGCVAIFGQAKDFAAVTRQKIKAELATHMSKGKWG